MKDENHFVHEKRKFVRCSGSKYLYWIIQAIDSSKKKFLNGKL